MVNKEKEENIECECGNRTMYVDTKIGEIVCTKCGLVQKRIWWKNEFYDR